MENGYATGLGERLLDRLNDGGVLGILVDISVQIFLKGLAGDGHHRGVQQATQILHHAGDAAGAEKCFHVGLSGGVDLGDLRCDLAQFLKLSQHIDVHFRLISDGRQMQHGVCGAADGHGDLHGVADGGGAHDLAGSDALLAQLHNGTTGFKGAPQTAGIGGGDQSAAGQGHTQRLGHTAHGIGGAQEGTGAAAGAGGVFQRCVFALGDLAGFHHAQRLRDGGQVGFTAVKFNAAQHGAAHTDDARNIQTGRSHQHGRHDLIAGSQQYQAVQPMSLSHDLDGVADDLTGGQDVVHTLVALRHTVTGGDRTKFHRGAAAGVNSVFHILGDLVQIVVTGDQRVPGASDADEGFALLQLAVGVAHGFEERAGECAVFFTQNRFASQSHNVLLISVNFPKIVVCSTLPFFVLK